jgi:ABC-type antimicrobial peptide transport system permease subunit
MVAWGVVIGLPSVWWLGQYVASQLYDVTPTDPLTIVGATLIVALMTLGSTLIPARQAASLNPTEALRR